MPLCRTIQLVSPLAGAALFTLAGCETTASEPAAEPFLSVDAATASVADAAMSAPTQPDAGPTVGLPAPAADAGRASSSTTPADGGPNDAAPGDAAPNDGGAGTGDAAAGDPRDVAKALDGLFIDAPCDSATPTPLAKGATCLHPGTTQHIERVVEIGGSPTARYDVALRVRGIWEPTKIQGGERPVAGHPLTVGGALPAGSGSSDAVSYQQYSIRVSSPMQTYWLNDHQYLAHDIHKEDYVATLRVAGGAKVTLVMNDGNERQIANWTKDFFADVPPYNTVPSTGQSLRLDVMSVQLVP
ncbi:MAG: hypothetical protein RL385_196 [Pseudomonadota bacterium]|jgi:hypothetical protein